MASYTTVIDSNIGYMLVFSISHELNVFQMENCHYFSVYTSPERQQGPALFDLRVILSLRINLLFYTQKNTIFHLYLLGQQKEKKKEKDFSIMPKLEEIANERSRR